MLFQMAPYFCNRIAGVLIRHKPACELHVGLVGQHGFSARALVAAVETVDFDGGPVPLACECAVAGLSVSARRADATKILFLIERWPLERMSQCRIDFLDIIVEAFVSG